MAADAGRLRPGELCRLLNSTPLGECLGERRLHRQRMRAGLRVAADGDPNRIHLVRYSAWILDRRHAPQPASASAAAEDGYGAHRERARLRSSLLSASGRDIGALPDVADRVRRDACARDFRLFCGTYLPRTFHLKWSPDHLRVIAKIETAVLEGGLFAMAMPRGSGKTSLCECACLWALLFGHREFVALVGSDEEHAAGMLSSIKAELEGNDALLDDFPEVCFPVRRLEGIHQRAAGQLHRGRQTQIGWTDREIVLPTVEGSRASGATIRVAGITGRLRGMKHKRSDGRSVRPSLVLVDDPQTDESARSPSQCEARERILAGAVLGLAGPGVKIAGLMTLTVVRADDLADRLLDRRRHPDWQGERTRMVYSFPSDVKLWARYAEIRAEGLVSGAGLRPATAFYLAHRDAMDEGAEVAWPERHNPDEASAVQHAMNLRLADERAFMAEYQNDPNPETREADEALTPDAIASKVSGLARGTVPLACTRVTAFVDVQGKILYWLACAWSDSFGGTVLDYGTEPEQPEAYFTARDPPRTLQAALPNAGPEAQIHAGLMRLADRLFARVWTREDGAELALERCVVDANWGTMTDVVYQVCRESRHRGSLVPGHGRYVGAASVPMAEYVRRQGDRVGLNWRMPSVAGKRAARHVVYDTNWWKSFAMARLATPRGDPGALVLFGRSPDAHRLLVEHLTSEHRVPTQGRGRQVDEWRLLADGRDNHWLDCLVGSAVAASMGGSALPGIGGPTRRKRRVVSFAELRGERGAA